MKTATTPKLTKLRIGTRVEIINGDWKGCRGPVSSAELGWYEVAVDSYPPGFVVELFPPKFSRGELRRLAKA